MQDTSEYKFDCSYVPLLQKCKFLGSASTSANYICATNSSYMYFYINFSDYDKKKLLHQLVWSINIMFIIIIIGLLTWNIYRLLQVDG